MALEQFRVPRVQIEYCTQCKWMLRAAYFGQELLSTFGTSIGEIALIPATGGIFSVHLTYHPAESSPLTTVLLWDRKAEGGFPETKILKQRLRNYIDPGKNLGHSDTPSKTAVAASEAETPTRTLAKEAVSTQPLELDSKVSKQSEDLTSEDQQSTAVMTPATEQCEDCK